MNRRTASLLVLVVLVSLCTFGSESQRNSTRAAANKRAAVVKTSAGIKSPSPAPTSIGFLSPQRNAAQGAIFGIFPAVMGDFAGNGNQDAATMVNVLTGGKPHYSISAAMNDGTGNFTTVLTATTETQQDPIFVADLNGDGKDDILLIHPADSPNHTYIQAWLSNGDGTFTAVNSGVSATTTGFVWATVADVNGDGCPDVVIADSNSPNGSIWTLLGKGDGTCDGSFSAPTGVAFTGALSAFGLGNPTMVPGNPMVFADFNGDGQLDFAAAAASGGTAASNQIVVYLCNSGTSPCTSYAAPALLATTDSHYDSTFLGGGDLTGDGKDELVSANGIDGNITVYVNNGSGAFATGVYYAAGAKPAAVSVADVNADSKSDIVVTDLNSGAIKVLLGNGDGTVGAPSLGYVTGGAPLMPALIAPFSGASNPVGVVLPDNQTNFTYLQGYGDGTFRSGVNYYAPAAGGGFEPEGVGLASGDFNGDGIPDVVIGNSDCSPKCNHAAITVFLSKGDGSLLPGVNLSPNGSYILQFVAVADFNGDGNLDIAASDTLNGLIWVFLGKGDGTFQNPVKYAADTAATPHTMGIVAVDLNGDGKPDLAFVNNFGTSISTPTTADIGVLINNGAGGFNPVANYALSTVATEITAASLRSNSTIDLVAPLYGICAAGSCTTPGSAVAILLGNGDGTFQAESDFSLVNGSSTYYNPYDAAIGDLNGDGKVDIAVTIQAVNPPFTQGIAVALGNGDGTFQTPTLLASSPQNATFASPPLPAYVKMVDLNRDGHLDLVYTNALQGTVGVMYGVGDGTFYDPIDFAADRWAWDFALADINGDGVLDVVASGFEQSFSGVGVLLNISGSSTVLQSSAPHSSSGQSVTLTATITGTKVKGATDATPTGTMAFFDGTTQLGQPQAISSGAAALGISTLAVGSHNITAQYSGDTSYVPTTSSVLVQVVGQGPSATGTPTSSANPSAPGQAVTLSVAVTSTIPGDTLVPTGNVAFNDGTTALGSGTLNSTGVATFTTSKLALGTHSITAVYGGDTNFTGSNSAALNQVIALPTYTLKASPPSQTVSPGSSASYTITLTPTAGYDGTVTFTCPATLPSGVSCTLPSPMAPPYAAATLMFTTTGPSGSLIMAPDVNPHQGTPNLWASLTGLGMLGMVLAGEWKKRNRQRLGVMLLVLALAMILALVGCGGGSSSGGGGGGGGGGGTPAGTYQITVTATGTAGTNNGNTTPQQLPLTLVVN